MKCEEIREMMPEMASDEKATTPQAGELEAFRKTMALLDEWRAPEPSPYFDVRLQARLREEMSKPQANWLAWFRQPVLAAALTVLMAIGVGLFLSQSGGVYNSGREVAGIEAPIAAAEPGTAVSDLQSLEKNHDLYSDFDLL